MFDDYQGQKTPLIRVGASYTQSRECRFSNFVDKATYPENAALFNSDGVNTFATGAFAPGVTVSDADYRMLAADAGAKMARTGCQHPVLFPMAEQVQS